MIRSRTRGRASAGQWFTNPFYQSGSSYPRFNFDLANNRYVVNQIPSTSASSITATRATIGTYVDSDGLIKTAAIDVPRFGYDPDTYAPLGLLVEPAGANLNNQSAQIQNGYWAKTGATITANALTAPDGTATAEILVENSLSSVHTFQKTTTLTATIGQVYTWSCFFKPQVRTEAVLSVGSAAFGSNLQAIFNLSGAGSVASRSAGLTATIKFYRKHGWYRCTITATATAAGQITPTAGAVLAGATTYTGTSSNAVGVWGAMLEASPYATSWIDTVASSVTRSEDIVKLASSVYSGQISSTAGTLVAYATPLYSDLSASPDAVLFSLDDNTTNEAITLFANKNGAATGRLDVIDGGVSQASISSTEIVGDVTYAYASAWAANDIASYVDGGQMGTDASATLPTTTQLVIGGRGNTTTVNQFGGHIGQIFYYNSRITNAELARLSATTVIPALTSWWPMTEGSGSTIRDVFNPTNTATINGTLTNVWTGSPGINFNGTDNTVTNPSPNDELNTIMNLSTLGSDQLLIWFVLSHPATITSGPVFWWGLNGSIGFGIHVLATNRNLQWRDRAVGSTNFTQIAITQTVPNQMYLNGSGGTNTRSSICLSIRANDLGFYEVFQAKTTMLVDGPISQRDTVIITPQYLPNSATGRTTFSPGVGFTWGAAPTTNQSTFSAILPTGYAIVNFGAQRRPIADDGIPLQVARELKLEPLAFPKRLRR